MLANFKNTVGDLFKAHDHFAQLQLVLWDLDGTLYDEMHFLEHAYGRIADRAAETSGADRKQAFDFLKQEFLAGGRQGLFDRFCETFQIPPSNIPAFLAIMRNEGWESPLAHHPLPRFLMQLFGALSVRQVIVTNGHPAQQLNKIERLAILPDGLVADIGFCDKLERKPSPTALLQAMAQFGATPERTILFGDSDVDALAASRAGISFVRFGLDAAAIEQ